MKRKCTKLNCSNYHKQLSESKVICPECGTPTEIFQITEPGRITHSFRSDFSSGRKCTKLNCSNYHKQLSESKVICPECGTPTEIFQITELGRITHSFRSDFSSGRKYTNPDCSNYRKELPESKVICPECAAPTDFKWIIWLFFPVMVFIWGAMMILYHQILITFSSRFPYLYYYIYLLSFFLLICWDYYFIRSDKYEYRKHLWQEEVIGLIIIIIINPILFLLVFSTDRPNISNTYTVPLSKEFSPLEISKTIKQEIQNQLPGELLINLPSEMTVGIRERVEIRLAKKGIRDFRKGLRGRGIPEIEKIKISPIMKVRLIGDKFDIKALSHEVQPITDFDFTQWEWNITPKEAGNQLLEISVSLRIEIPQINEPLLKDYPVYEKKIKVKVSQFEIMKLLILGTIVLLVLWIILNNRSNLNAWIKRKKFNKRSEKLDKIKSQVFKSIRIVLENGNLGIGFSSITVQILSEGNILPIQYRGELPPAPEIIEVYHHWQSQYNRFIGFIKSSRMEKIQSNRTNVSKVDIDKLAEELEGKLNKWLNAEQFLAIDRILRERFNRSDEIQVIIQSENIHVRRLPWHLWDFLKPYRKAEIALSSPFYDRTLKTAVTRNRIRILSILGDDKGIDINKDRQLLDKIDAETTFIVKRNRQELNEQLWSEQGWDILCFSGHSSSEMDGSNGWIYINDTDKLTIPELKNALRTAIERGLQIAIFNSCDGLGLANQLASLHIPQIIVMREPVPDAVAQEFLKNFLTGFASGKSFYLAVREAREKLQPLEQYYPCASWLPVICQNPAEIPPTWDSLRGISRGT